ncbi:Protein CBG10878 [Caenorhabditis briggsae]|uniref:Glycosyl hydrolase family 63 C-terminal domain-containing protein n=2 Tax=Caenorhabditis briggsae TaxID=6238 RepID=A0AAE8ZQW5_CAEBR|nr:Protein CBG10878 [Caenorhabditis briggsae]ULT82867.1 hypothetical protein L3Y34_012244 [Caenorhabditis briggsae]CAP30169.1 Protein CBG10878 [Caenorhabditis briggsae]
MANKTSEPTGNNSQAGPTEESSAITTNNENNKPVKPDNANSNVNSLSMPVKLTALLAIGALLSVVASFGVQFYNDTYVRPVQKDRTFPFLGGKETNGTRLRILQAPSSQRPLLQLLEPDRPWNPSFIVEVLVNGTVFPLNAFQERVYETLDVYNGGKLTVKYDVFSLTIAHIIYPNSTIGFYVNSNGKPLNGTEENLELKISGRGVKWIKIPLTPAGNYYQTFPSTQEEAFSNHEEIKNDVANLEERWNKKFDEWFASTGQQNLPAAYIEIMKAAYSMVANSLSVVQNFPMMGKYGFFVDEVNYFFLMPISITYTTLDEQFFAIMTLSKLNVEDTMRVIRSYISLSNELGHMANRLVFGTVELFPIQSPMLFQVIKELLSNPKFDNEYQDIIENLDYIAENTWKNSIGKGGVKDVKWTGDSRGVFDLEPATSKNTSSLELLCLLGDMSLVMKNVYKKVGDDKNSVKWEKRATDVNEAMASYWNNEKKEYGDIVNEKIEKGPWPHVPLILGIVKEDSENLGQLLKNLQDDPNFTQLGLQTSEEQGIAVSTNYLLLRSLKHYAGLSGPSQEIAHRMYSVLKNNMAAAIARAHRAEKSFFGRYDKNMRPLGPKENLDGTLVFSIMSSP